MIDSMVEMVTPLLPDGDAVGGGRTGGRGTVSEEEEIGRGLELFGTGD